MIINKNEFFAILAKHGANNSFAKAMLDGTIPAEIKYQFDSTYEWDTELPIVREMLEFFMYIGIVPKEMQEEILGKTVLADTTTIKKYDISKIGGELYKWVATNISPADVKFIIDSAGNIVTTTGILPLPEVK